MLKRNKFSLSHYKLLTMDMGYLVPLTWYATLPGDSFQQRTSALIRCSPLLAPVMHPVDVRINHWFVPLRLIWDDFEDFITGGEDGTDSTTPPYRDLNAVDYSGQESNLVDYMGINPVDYTGTGIDIGMLPFRAYNLIFNEFFRDQDLVTARVNNTTSGLDVTTAIGSLASVAWEKDYFTTAREAPQKGAAITIPLSEDSLPIKGIGKSNDGTFKDSSITVRQSGDTSTSTFTNAAGMDAADADEIFFIEGTDPTDGYPNIRVDGSSVGIDIDDFRLSMALQRYQEARNRYGARYPEYLKYLGIRPDDRSLQRPVYLGGGKQTIQFSEVLSMSTGDGSDTVGNMQGHGISAMRTNQFRKFFNEHGIVMTLMSVKPRTIYSQGLHREFSKTVKEDYFQRELQDVGDQEILCKELYVESADPEDTFGYQDRYDEYRSIPSGIAGEFRSTLNHWHLARQFAVEPSLNSTFVTAAPTKRVLASTNTDALYVMANHSIQARRPIRKRR